MTASLVLAFLNTVFLLILAYRWGRVDGYRSALRDMRSILVKYGVKPESVTGAGDAT